MKIHKTALLKIATALILILYINITGFSQTFSENNLNYNILSTDTITGFNTVEITGGTFTNPLIIPSTVTDGTDTYTVTTVGNSAFRNRGVTSVVLPNTLTTIEFRAFRDNNNLTSVTIPASVTSIATEAFFSGGIIEVIAEGTIPASINTNGSFKNQNSNIDVSLTLPICAIQDYLNAGWTNFEPISALSSTDVTVFTNLPTCEAIVTLPQPDIFISTCNNTLIQTTGNIPYNFSNGDLIDTPSTLFNLDSTTSDVTLELIFSGDHNTSTEGFKLLGPDLITLIDTADLSLCNENIETIIIPQNTWNDWIATFGTDLSFVLQEDSNVDQGQCELNESYYRLSLSQPESLLITNDFTGSDNASGQYPLGTTIVNWTVEDVNGNILDTCQQLVTVEDNISPIQVILPPSGANYTIDTTLSPNYISIIDSTNFVGTGFDSAFTIPLGFNFSLYDHIINEIMVSTSGYLSVDPSDSGGDFTNDCPLPQTPSNGVNTARLYPLHEDLLTEIYAQNFEISPYPHPNGDIMAATIIEWSGEHFGSSDSTAVDSTAAATAVQFQALLFENGDIIYQYAADNEDGAGATIGAQESGTGQAISIACDSVGTSVSAQIYGLSPYGGTLDSSPITTFADTIVENDSGTCSAVIIYNDSLSFFDSCGGSVSVSQTTGLPSGSLFPVGITTNTFVATDEAGNTTTLSFDVTVNDVENPIAVCQDITVQLDGNGEAIITGSDLDGGSTDNCGITSITALPNTFGIADIGNNIVTLTVTDANGNEATCESIVTVLADNLSEDCINLTAPIVHDVEVLSTTSALVTWDAVPGAVFYQVKYRKKGTTNFLTKGTAGTQRVLNGLEANKFHQYKIRSQCADGIWSDFTEIEIFHTSTCLIPTGIASVVLDENRARIRWDADPDVDRGRVQFRELGTTAWSIKVGLSGKNFLFITGLNPGTTYQFRLRTICNDDGFSAYSDKFLFTTDSASPARLTAENTLMKDMKLYPNPAQNEVNVSFESVISDDVKMVITDVLGKVLQSQISVSQEGNNIETINVSQLTKGYYLLTIHHGNEVKTIKFIKS